MRIRKKDEIIARIEELRAEPITYMERTRDAKLYEGAYRNGYIKALKWVLRS